MIVRIEEVKDSDVILVVGELEDFKGKMYYADFAECVLEERESFIEDGHIWWHVEKQLINKYLNGK